MTARRLRAALGFVTAACVLIASAVARADDKQPITPTTLPQRSATLVQEQKIVKLTVAFRDVVDAEATRKLTSGLPTIIALRAYVFVDGSSSPIALTAKTCRVVFDLWDEVFRIQLTQPGAVKNVVAVNLEGVLRNCAEARKMPLADGAQLKMDTRYFVAAIAEVNPISEDTMDRIRRWVARPHGSTTIGPGDSLFGSFVGLFVSRIESADRRVAFRTQAFAPPKEEPPPPKGGTLRVADEWRLARRRMGYELDDASAPPPADDDSAPDFEEWPPAAPRSAPPQK